MLADAAHLQNLGISFFSIQLHHQISEKVRVMVIGERAGVHRCRGFWRLRHVVKLAETLFDSGAYLVVLQGFHCSQRGDVRTAGIDFTLFLPLI
jgi:hypothetical protein